MTAWPDLPDRALGLVDEVQRAALVEERRRRRVEVLRAVSRPPSPSAPRIRPPSPIARAVLVPDREEDPAAELVDDAAAALAIARRGQPDLDELVRLDVRRFSMSCPAHRVPAVGRPAELERLDRLVGEAAALEVVERGLAEAGRGQDLVVERDRRLEDVAQARPVGVLALRPLVDLDAGLRGERLERLRERRRRRAASRSRRRRRPARSRSTSRSRGPG